MARRTPPADPPTDDTLEAADEAADSSPAASPASSPAAAPDSSSPGGETPPPSGFFAWLRMLDLPRRSGWLGGVCAGLAERIGIDPMLVRGVVVVLAVVGAPVVLLYALAWALLPDESGSIHVEELPRGRVPRAVPGILAMFLLSFLPLTQGFWNVGSWYWGDLGWDGALVRAVWTAVILIAVIVGVVLLARHASATPRARDGAASDSAPFVADATADATVSASESATASASPAADGGRAEYGPTSAAAAVTPQSADPGEPPAMPADASDEQLAAWKESQQQWQQQRAEWVAEQRRSDRERRQADAHARALEASRVAAERTRIRRLTQPRARAGVVFLVLGIGLVAAGVAALWASQSRATESVAWVIGAATLVLVLGVGTVAVALGRRRSGALGMFSLLAVLILAVTVALPSDRTMLAFGTYGSVSEAGRYAQPFGTVGIFVDDRNGAPRVIDVWQYSGGVHVHLAGGATVRIDVTTDADTFSMGLDQTLADGTSQYSRFDATTKQMSITFGDGAPDVIVKLWAHESWVSVSATGELTAPVTASKTPDYIQRTNDRDQTFEPHTSDSTEPLPTNDADGSAGVTDPAEAPADTTQGVTP